MTTVSFVSAMYYRIYYQIALANEFIRYCSDEWMTDKGFTDAEKSMIAGYLAEARYLRAMSYYHALDLFGQMCHTLWMSQIDQGVYFPEQISRSNLFTWVESELNAIESGMMDARSAPYGRADQGALWALRAKLYLNAEVYTGNPKYDLAMADALSIINAGYTLETNYAYNFMADNHLSTEVIFPSDF